MRKLPKPRFNLKAPKAKSETLIFLVFRYRGKKLLYSTGLNIHPKDWDTKAQRPIQKERRKDLWLLQRQIENLAALCTEIFIQSDYGNISIEKFKTLLDQDGVEKPKPKPKKVKTEVKKVEKPEFLKFLDLEMAEMKRTGMNKDTLRSFRVHANIIKKFAKKYGPIAYEDVDWGFRLELIDWLSNRNVQLSYGNKTLKILRMFLERARKKKLHNNTDYLGNGWLVPQTKAKGPKVIVSQEELSVLADLQLSGPYAKTRDLFLIGSGTGQRFSDYSKYEPDHFYKSVQGIPLLSIVSQKTNTPTKVPLNIFPWLIPILERHDYASPKLSLQRFNEWIKEICIEVGFDDKVLKIEQYMGRKPRIVRNYVPRYTGIASHTCRRSFATNLYKMGYQMSKIMPMTGHSTEAQLRQYIGLDSEENAVAVGQDFL